MSRCLDMIERMFDTELLQREGPSSAFETLLRRWLGQGRPVLELISAQAVAEVAYRPHGRRSEVGAKDEVEPEWRPIVGRIEAGAAHLSAAREAYREQCRQAAVQARELAAFAAERPGNL